MDQKLIRRYDSKDGAAAYRNKYRRSLSRRLSHRREVTILRRALRRAGARGHLLDCPCGAGRMTPHLLAFAERVTCVDLAGAMITEARHALASTMATFPDRIAFQCASAMDLPFPDDTFHTSVCHRLIHHLPNAKDRHAVLSELARVSSDRVVCSFSDATTRKARSQVRRGVTRNRYALDPSELKTQAKACGLTMVGAPLRLNTFTSLVAIAVFAVDSGVPVATRHHAPHHEGDVVD